MFFIKTKFINKEIKYDGSQLKSHYIFKEFNILGNSLIAFIGPCEVNLDKMVDLLDVKRKEKIYSERMLHFLGEFFNLDLEKGIYLQRTLITLIKEKLEEKIKQRIIRKGDDLFIENKKLSVSIATLSLVSTLIHIGLNISSFNTPVPTISLDDLKVNPKNFAKALFNNFKQELESIYLASCKVRGV
ncbi:MAG: DUF366 family protein [Armatimonadetes bacterium]|nr:DUF366 family protein [Armatimonadota bacterium]